MSPWWSDRIRVGLGSAHVHAVRVRGRSSRVLAAQVVDCPMVEGQPAWQGLLTAFAQGLDAVREKGKKVACTVVAGNAWVRYQLVPWQEGLSGSREYLSYAIHQFRSVYGSLAETWEVTCSEPRYGQPALACAIDKHLLSGLQQVTANAGVSLASVTPYFCAAVARWRSSVPEKDYWFGLIEGERICLMRTAKGVPRLLRVQAVREDVVTELAAMLQRESIGLGQNAPDVPVYLFGPALRLDVQRAFRERRVRTFDAMPYLTAAGSDAHYAMALV